MDFYLAKNRKELDIILAYLEKNDYYWVDGNLPTDLFKKKLTYQRHYDEIKSLLSKEELVIVNNKGLTFGALDRIFDDYDSPSMITVDMIEPVFIEWE